MSSKSSAFDAVVVDFGGVLITPITHLLDEIAMWHRIPMERMLDVLMGPREWSTSDHPWHRAERGEIPISVLQAEVAPLAASAGIQLRGDEYERLLSGDFFVNTAMVGRVAELRAAGYRIGLLTNSFREFRSVIEERVDISLFDAVVDSSFVGCRKPEPEIYQLMAEMLAIDPTRIVYLDDFEANLDGARSAGWTTVHVTDVEVALLELDRVLAPGDRLAPPDWSGGGAFEDGSGLGDDLFSGGAGGEDGGDAGGLQLVEVVVGNDAAHDHGDVAPAAAHLPHDEGSEREVGAGEHRETDGVDVFVDGGGGDGFGGLEQARVDHLVAGVAEDPSHHFDAPIVSVEAHLGDQDPGGHQITDDS
jgi:epoxide hydrolase-like predicted phosphatase